MGSSPGKNRKYFHLKYSGERRIEVNQQEYSIRRIDSQSTSSSVRITIINKGDLRISEITMTTFAATTLCHHVQLESEERSVDSTTHLSQPMTNARATEPPPLTGKLTEVELI